MLGGRGGGRRDSHPVDLGIRAALRAQRAVAQGDAGADRPARGDHRRGRFRAATWSRSPRRGRAGSTRSPATTTTWPPTSEQLEQARDTVDSPEASGEAIAQEFEQYLKRRDGGKADGRDPRPATTPGGRPAPSRVSGRWFRYARAARSLVSRVLALSGLSSRPSLRGRRSKPRTGLGFDTLALARSLLNRPRSSGGLSSRPSLRGRRIETASAGAGFDTLALALATQPADVSSGLSSDRARGRRIETAPARQGFDTLALARRYSTDRGFQRVE